MGASSRVTPNAEMSPLSCPRDSRFNALNASIPIDAPIAAPSSNISGTTPPPMMIEPRPQVISVMALMV